MLKLREELAAKEDRLAGRAGTTPDELENYLDSIINERARNSLFSPMVPKDPMYDPKNHIPTP